MKPNAKLLLIEAVVPVDDREHLAKLLELGMLVALTGRERTEAECLRADTSWVAVTHDVSD
jgi:hypothetical protein